LHAIASVSLHDLCMKTSIDASRLLKGSPVYSAVTLFDTTNTYQSPKSISGWDRESISNLTSQHAEATGSTTLPCLVFIWEVPSDEEFGSIEYHKVAIRDQGLDREQTKHSRFSN
jgi:hypothetical protein